MDINNLNRFVTHRYIALTTYRKNGAGVTTPVWFVKQSERLLVWTSQDSGKVKRLRRNQKVRFGPSDHGGKLLGEVEEGVARLIPENEHPALQKAFQIKYGWQQRLFAAIWKLQKHRHTYIEITKG